MAVPCAWMGAGRATRSLARSLAPDSFAGSEPSRYRRGMNDVVLLREIATASGHRFGHATLNQPASLNALTLPMVDALQGALDRWAADPGVVGVVLDGAGDKAFCAGGDVVALLHAIRATPAGEVPRLASDFFAHEYRLDHAIHAYPKPLLCWGHGHVLGGGLGLLAGASHRVVTPRSRLAMPEIPLGLFPDVGGSWFLRRLPGRAGLFIGLTAAPLNAADARFAGLADVVLPHEQHAAVLSDVAAMAWSADAAKNGARLSHLLERHSVELPPESSNLRRHFELIDSVIGHDSLDEIAVRLAELAEHPEPWIASAASRFIEGSPTSAALAHALWQRVPRLGLADVLRIEYDVAVACCMHHDFAEGVRALLLDKDRRPRWQPASLAEVDAALVAAHFVPRRTGSHPLADLRD